MNSPPPPPRGRPPAVPPHAPRPAAGVRARRLGEEVPVAPADLGPWLRLGALVPSAGRCLPYHLLRRLCAGLPAILGVAAEVPHVGRDAFLDLVGHRHDGRLPERRQHRDQAEALYHRVDAGHSGARAPGEHEPRDTVLGPSTKRAWRHLDCAVQLALASLLGLDEQQPRRRLPGVPLGQPGQPAPPLHGQLSQAFRQGRVIDF
mmetsp:Transcript_4452/g.13500  ORF Transcript_4452/g.13500 Transcript_4452/m.13500 type:complete len:204 (+) Transcript_4452:46-657(+)